MEEMTNNVIETVEAKVVEESLPGAAALPNGGGLAKAVIFGAGFAAAVAAGSITRFVMKKVKQRRDEEELRKGNSGTNDEAEFEAEVISDEDSE